MRTISLLALRPALYVPLVMLAALAPACGTGEPAPDSGAALILYEASAAGVTNIFTIDPDSGESHQLTDAEEYDGSPAWSPGRERIVFSSKRGGLERNDLFVMDRDGGNVRRLTDTPEESEQSPRYAPDGARIAFVSDTAAGWNVEVMSSDGEERRRVAGPYEFAEFPAWSLDGRELFFAAIEAEAAAAPAAQGTAADYASSSGATSHIYSVDLATLEVRTRIETAGIDVCPHVTPDGRRLLYASTRTADNATHRVFVHDLDSTDTTGAADAQLTPDGSRSDYPDPAPDGRRIVFASDRDGNTELYVMNADGTDQRRLTDTPDARENVPDW